MPDIVGLMSTLEIAAVNQIRWRVGICDRRMKEAVELLRVVAAVPGYCGPPVEVVERLADIIGEIRGQIHSWTLKEHAGRTRCLRIASRGKRNSIKGAIAELYGRG